jgi:hypothetical protein
VITGPYFESLTKSIVSASERLIIISPYITTETLEQLLDGTDIPVVIVTSWRKSEFISGLASLELANICKAKNWELRVFHDAHKRNLHSKIYVIDEKVFFGSANLTRSGFQLTENPNYEVLETADYNGHWVYCVKELIEKSQYMDDALYGLFYEKVNQLPPSTPASTEKWDMSPGVLTPFFTEEEKTIVNDIDITTLLWSTMPQKPSSDEINSFANGEIPIEIYGRRWGSFRQTLGSLSITKEYGDELIDRFYNLIIRKFPNDFDNSYAEPGGYTECLVWRINGIS